MAKIALILGYKWYFDTTLQHINTDVKQ